MNCPSLESERLLLRKLELSDIDDVVQGLNNRNVSKWFLGIPYPFTKENAQEYIQKDEDYRWGIVTKAENKVIGIMNLMERDHNFAPKPNICMETWINEKYRGHSFGLEANCLCIDFVFKAFEIQAITVVYSEENMPSIIQTDRLGFRCLYGKGECILGYLTKKSWLDGKHNNPYYDMISKYIPSSNTEEYDMKNKRNIEKRSL